MRDELRRPPAADEMHTLAWLLATAAAAVLTDQGALPVVVPVAVAFGLAANLGWSFAHSRIGGYVDAAARAVHDAERSAAQSRAFYERSQRHYDAAQRLHAAHRDGAVADVVVIPPPRNDDA